MKIFRNENEIISLESVKKIFSSDKMLTEMRNGKKTFYTSIVIAYMNDDYEYEHIYSPNYTTTEKVNAWVNKTLTDIEHILRND